MVGILTLSCCICCLLIGLNSSWSIFVIGRTSAGFLGTSAENLGCSAGTLGRSALVLSACALFSSLLRLPPCIDSTLIWLKVNRKSVFCNIYRQPNILNTKNPRQSTKQGLCSVHWVLTVYNTGTALFALYESSATSLDVCSEGTAWQLWGAKNKSSSSFPFPTPH